MSFSVDTKELVVRVLKYILEGSVVAIAAWLIPSKKPSLEEVFTLALVAAATFSILDLFLPSISASARMGVGLGIGASLTPLGRGMVAM
jgi:ABC-type Co2+ transport system permease subunit